MAQELALPLVGGRLNVSTISELSGTPAWPLLSSDADARDAARALAASPKMRAVITDACEPLQRMAQPCGDQGVYEAMQTLFIMYGRPKKAEAEMTIWWTLYYKALSGLPRSALDNAINEYIRTSTIHMVPAPGILSKLADGEAELIRKAAYRAKLALQIGAPERRKEPSQEERAEARQFLEDLRRNGSLGKPVTLSQPVESRAQMAARLRGAMARS